MTKEDIDYRHSIHDKNTNYYKTSERPKPSASYSGVNSVKSYGDTKPASFDHTFNSAANNELSNLESNNKQDVKKSLAKLLARQLVNQQLGISGMDNPVSELAEAVGFRMGEFSGILSQDSSLSNSAHDVDMRESDRAGTSSK